MVYDKIALTPQDILEKEFKLDARGYRPQEVDQFLDEVIKTMQTLIGTIKKLDAENKSLVEDNLQLKHELRKMNDNIEAFRGNKKDISSVDVLRRLSQLEKIVYGDEQE